MNVDYAIMEKENISINSMVCVLWFVFSPSRYLGGRAPSISHRGRLYLKYKIQCGRERVN